MTYCRMSYQSQIKRYYKYRWRIRQWAKRIGGANYHLIGFNNKLNRTQFSKDSRVFDEKTNKNTIKN